MKGNSSIIVIVILIAVYVILFVVRRRMRVLLLLLLPTWMKKLTYRHQGHFLSLPFYYCFLRVFSIDFPIFCSILL